jgi:uncharacterized membrane protein HdeD (DUF308 family)
MQAMSQSPSLAHRPLLTALSKNWWVVLLRGIVFIIFGVLAFAWPGLTLITLVLFYGAFALIDGVLSLFSAFKGGQKVAPPWWLVVVGLIGIAAGGATFLWPGLSALVLLLFIGAWALVRGIFEIIGAIQLRKEIDNEWMLILSGAVSVIFGLIMLIMPGAGAVALVWVIAAYSIVIGVLLIGLSLRLRTLGDGGTGSRKTP